MNAAESFLLDAAEDITPLHYTDPRGDVHRVILTQLSKDRPYKFEGRVEPVWNLTFVDAWSGFSITDAEGAKIAGVAAVSTYDHVTSRWGQVEWGYFQWE